MARTYTHTLESDNNAGIALPIQLAHETGERCTITDKKGNIVAGIVTANDLKRLEGIESTNPA